MTHERERFEAWWKKLAGVAEDLARHDGPIAGIYKYDDVALAWSTWQAAVAAHAVARGRGERGVHVRSETEGVGAMKTSAHAAVIEAARVVMQYLAEHGPSIVPHLLDTDDNPGQRLREAIALYDAYNLSNRVRRIEKAALDILNDAELDSNGYPVDFNIGRLEDALAVEPDEPDMHLCECGRAVCYGYEDECPCKRVDDECPYCGSKRKDQVLMPCQMKGPHSWHNEESQP